jgi:hypothetical protein
MSNLVGRGQGGECAFWRGHLVMSGSLQVLGGSARVRVSVYLSLSYSRNFFGPRTSRGLGEWMQLRQSAGAVLANAAGALKTDCRHARERQTTSE